MDTTTKPASTAAVLVSSVLHKITTGEKAAIPIEVSARVPDLEAYLQKLLKEISEQSQKRSYKFDSPATEFRTCLREFHAHQQLASNAHAGLLANRLLRQELETLEKYKNLNDLTRGSFLQFLFHDELGQLSYLGVKVEHQSFLDEIDFTRKFGLAEERRLYKACRVTFGSEGEPMDVWVFDTNGKPAAYWWREFLELTVLRDDAENTKAAAEAVIQVVGGIKRSYPADHTILRNATVAAFKQQSQMNYSEFITQTFENYEPTDAAAGPAIGKLVERLRQLPEKKNFDTQFALVPSAVPYRQNKIALSSEITLTIKDGIADLADKIWSERTKDGRELVVIESDQAKRFPMKKRDA